MGFTGEFDEAFIDHEEEVRQGDVLQLLPTRESDPWASHLAVVVTANCDLAYGKHGGVLSYVPMVPLRDFLGLHILPRIIADERRSARSALNDIAEAYPNGPTPDRLLEQIELGHSVESIVDQFEAAPLRHDVVLHLRRFDAALRYTARHASGDNASDWSQSLDSFLAELRVIAGKPPAQDLARKELKSRLKSLPGDCYFVGRPAPNYSDGYVAYLRLVRDLKPELVALSAVHERRLGSRSVARRVGRLAHLYIHRLTQQLAHVFTDIGLPRDYEEHRDLAIKNNLESVVPTASTPSR